MSVAAIPDPLRSAPELKRAAANGVTVAEPHHIGAAG